MNCSSVGIVAIGMVEQLWVRIMSAGGSLPMIVVDGWRCISFSAVTFAKSSPWCERTFEMISRAL